MSKRSPELLLVTIMMALVAATAIILGAVVWSKAQTEVAPANDVMPPEVETLARRWAGFEEEPKNDVAVSTEVVENTSEVAQAAREALAEAEADREEAIGKTREEVLNKSWKIRIKTGTTIEMLVDKVHRKMASPDALNEWFRRDEHPTEFAQLKPLEKTFNGKAMEVVLRTYPGNPSTQFVRDEMAREGLRPANTAELMAFAAKMFGADRLIRVYAIGGDPYRIKDPPEENYPYVLWQTDPLVYWQPGPSKDWKQTWVMSLNWADPPGGWNQGKGWEDPKNPNDTFLAIKIEK